MAKVADKKREATDDEAADKEREAAMRTLLHPTRAAILATIGKREMSPSDVAKELGYPKGQLGRIAYHFRPLLERNMVRVTRTQHVRGAIETFYAVQPESVKRCRDQLAATLGQLDTALRAQAPRKPRRR